jgi:O-antigen biosynthesis protein WbqV
MLDAAEANLFHIDRELGEAWPQLPRRDVLCDVRDAAGWSCVFAEEKPDIVFHAAALKHVTLVENHPCEGVRTNVMGTRNVAVAAKACGAAHLALISTDKAVAPTSVMGAAKRVAEAVARQFAAAAATCASASCASAMCWARPVRSCRSSRARSLGAVR